ncbi:MAG: hypothetical protein EPN26_14990, partial [Rhodospirillales bacterium]
MPSDFARFERVYHYLEAHDGSGFLRQRLRSFLHINHCIAEGELDLIHNLVDEHMGDTLPADLRAGHWGIPDDTREKMLTLRRNGDSNMARSGPAAVEAVAKPAEPAPGEG